MKLLWLALVVSMFVPARPSSQRPAVRPPSAEQARRDLLALESHWLQVENDPAALESILAPDFLHVLPAGIITKQAQLDYMRAHPSPQRRRPRHFENMHVRIYGSVGIVNGMVVVTGPSPSRNSLFTDVFVYRDGTWQAVNAQESPAAKSGK